ncbi:MAG: acyl-CoA dehydrogenase family protein [Casimicrobiaceae bacterium]
MPEPKPSPRGAMHADHHAWPFLDPAHADLARVVAVWVDASPVDDAGADVDAACRQWVRALGSAGFLRHCIPASEGGVRDALDSRSLCVLRETLAYRDGLADFAFAMQGLGSAPITLAGSPAQRRQWLGRVGRGEAIAAFALSEPEAGSDVAALATRAMRHGDDWVLDGCKTWISNGGIADFYVVFARTGAAGTRGISAFLVPANNPGLTVAERIEVMAPHPLARLAFDACRLPGDALIGAEGEGFKLAMRTLDIFRASVGAAALGFARRALDLAVGHARTRPMFGATLADKDLAIAAIGDMATRIDAAALLVYRAAWLADTRGGRTTTVSAMAKLAATEGAQAVIDAALQLHGGRGVRVGEPIEHLYREIRALRIYEGATEVQRLIVGRDVLARQRNGETT